MASGGWTPQTVVYCATSPEKIIRINQFFVQWPMIIKLGHFNFQNFLIYVTCRIVTTLNLQCQDFNPNLLKYEYQKVLRAFEL